MNQLTQSKNTAARVGLILAREARGWTQQYLADQIGSTFVSISRWETGARTPNPYFRRKLVATLNKTEAELDLIMPSLAINAAPLPEFLAPQPPVSLQAQFWRLGSLLTTGGLTLIAIIAAILAWRAPNVRR